MSNVKVFVLMAGMTALFGAVGGMIGGQGGMMMALVFAALMNVVMYWASAKMVLRMYGAQTLTREQAPELYDMVDRLRRRAGLPMPTLAIAPHDQPNAFATGRDYDHAVVCVTQGLLQLVPRDELEGVIAHELAHIKNRDMLLQTVTATLAGAISNIAQFGLFFGGGDDDAPNPVAAIGARTSISSPAIGLPPSSSLESPPKKKPNCASIEIAPATVAATVIVSVSRFLMCASSCAITPSSSSRETSRRIPSVTHTTAFSGLRPVAKALGWSCGATATVGIGSPARWRSRSTIPYSSGSSAAVTVRAPYARSTIPAEPQYMKKFMPPASSSAIHMPLAPPISWPIAMKSAVRPASSAKTFTLFMSLPRQS